MTAFLLTPDAPIVAMGLAAAVFLTATPLFRTRPVILMAQLVAGLCFAAHYALLGLAVASAVNILGAVQTFAAIFSTRSAAMSRLGYALVCLMALTGLWFWQGPISAVSVVAMTLIALARLQTDELHLRVLLLAGGCVWMVHDYVGEAWLALLADIGAVGAGLAVLALTRLRVTIGWLTSEGLPAI
jgi:hypothetical protein